MTEPNEEPKTELTSLLFSRLTKELCADAAAVSSEPVKANNSVTEIELATTEVMEMLQTAFNFAKMFASSTLTNCRTTTVSFSSALLYTGSMCRERGRPPWQCS